VISAVAALLIGGELEYLGLRAGPIAVTTTVLGALLPIGGNNTCRPERPGGTSSPTAVVGPITRRLITLDT
jgi:hypothetical protein